MGCWELASIPQKHHNSPQHALFVYAGLPHSLRLLSFLTLGLVGAETVHPTLFSTLAGLPNAPLLPRLDKCCHFIDQGNQLPWPPLAFLSPHRV
jgi:hypothetical protein